MKKKLLFITLSVFLTTQMHAGTRYWIGPVNGNWSNPVNWSLTGIPGTGGAGAPGANDTAKFSFIHTFLSANIVNLDVSPTVSALLVDTVTTVNLYTSVNTTFTVNYRLYVYGSLTDSTANNVSFNFIFSHATGSIMQTAKTKQAFWIFSGRVPVLSGSTGATFLSGAGSLVNVAQGGNILFRNNTNYITSAPATLTFAAGSNFILENNMDATIPAATWADALNASSTPSPYPYVPAAVIRINGNAQNISHSVYTAYGSIIIDLPALSSDVNLALPNGTQLREFLSVKNTNNHTLTLLSGTSPTASVSVSIAGNVYGGGLNIDDDSSKVALANAPASAPQTSYKLEVPDFIQTGGNFSLQDANTYTGASVLAVKRNFNETGGTFITHSTATNSTTRFVVEILGPYYVPRPYGPDFTGQSITVSSGSINNATNMVTLKMAQVPFTYTSTGISYLSPIGITLNSSLQVGRLELNGGPIFPNLFSSLTVVNPSLSAVQVTGNNSYVNGLVKRATNSTGPYMFPTGAGTHTVFNLDTCVVIPSTAALSSYQAIYYNSGYSDLGRTGFLQGVSSNQYWIINRISGSDAQVKLILTGTVPGTHSSITEKLLVAQYTALEKWHGAQGTYLSPANSATGSVTSQVLSTFGPFTFGYAFILFYPFPLSNQTDLSNQTMSSSADNITELMSLAPTLVTGSASLRINALKAGQMELMVTDIAGRSWKKLILPVNAGSSTHTLNLSDFPAGTYLISGYINGKQTATIRFIKQ